MGNIPMKCPNCGTTNLNDMIVEYLAVTLSGEEYVDTTTLPKFLYGMEHPSDRRGRFRVAIPAHRVLEVRGYFCAKCLEQGVSPRPRIPSRRFGI